MGSCHEKVSLAGSGHGGAAGLCQEDLTQESVQWGCLRVATRVPSGGGEVQEGGRDPGACLENAFDSGKGTG